MAKRNEPDSNARRTTLQARKQQVVREAIWDAGIELFAKKGFDETTIEDIVEAAGVSRRSFFRYFSSKADLISQWNTESFQILFTDAIEHCPGSLAVADVLRYTVVEVARQSATERTRRIMDIAEKHPAAREALGRIAGAQGSIAAAYAARIGKGRKIGTPAHLLAGMTLFSLGAIIHTWCENPADSIESIGDRVFGTLHDLVRDFDVPLAEARADKKLRRIRN